MFPARERFRRLPADVGRDEYFCALAEAVQEFYLANPANPYQQSGRSSGAARWEETRRILVQALHRDGDFMDVGCANGLLLETLTAWARGEGFTLRPYGIDFVPALVELARARFPDSQDAFEVANAFYWFPNRRYDYVRTNFEYVPERDWVPFLRRQYQAVAPGGRLIVCHYRNADEPYVDVGRVVVDAGLTVTGCTEVPGVAVAWVEHPP